MRYTQGQVRELLDIPEQTFRHWRSVIPALRELSGKGARFSPGHLLAIAVLAQLDRDFELRVTKVASGINELFHILAEKPWPALEQMAIELTKDEATIRRPEQITPLTSGLCLLISCSPLIRALRSKLLESSESEAQGSLQFSPHDLRGRGR